MENELQDIGEQIISKLQELNDQLDELLKSFRESKNEKNHQIHLFLDKDLKEKLQKESDKLEIPLSELCRHKLQNSIPLTKTKFFLEKLVRELNIMQNSDKRSSEFCY